MIIIEEAYLPILRVANESKVAMIVDLSCQMHWALLARSKTSNKEQENTDDVILPKSVDESNAMINDWPSELNLADTNVGVGGSSPSPNMRIKLPRGYTISYSADELPVLVIDSDIVDALDANFIVEAPIEKYVVGTSATLELKLTRPGNKVVLVTGVPILSNKASSIFKETSFDGNELIPNDRALKTPALSATVDTTLLFSMIVISLQHNVVTIVLVIRTSASGDVLPSRELVEQNIE